MKKIIVVGLFSLLTLVNTSHAANSDIEANSKSLNPVSWFNDQGHYVDAFIEEFDEETCVRSTTNVVLHTYSNDLLSEPDVFGYLYSEKRDCDGAVIEVIFAEGEVTLYSIDSRLQSASFKQTLNGTRTVVGEDDPIEVRLTVSLTLAAVKIAPALSRNDGRFQNDCRSSFSVGVNKSRPAVGTVSIASSLSKNGEPVEVNGQISSWASTTAVEEIAPVCYGSRKG